MRIKFDGDIIKNISLFESITKAKVKDCFEDDQQTLVFVVMPGQIVKAIGKNGTTAKKLKDILKKKVKVVEFNNNVISFVKSLVLPLKPDVIEEIDNIIYMKSNDIRTKGLLIGKAASNLRNYESIVQRYFSNIEELKVVDNIEETKQEIQQETQQIENVEDSVDISEKPKEENKKEDTVEKHEDKDNIKEVEIETKTDSSEEVENKESAENK